MDKSVEQLEQQRKTLYERTLPPDMPLKSICRNCGGTMYRLWLNPRIMLSTHLPEEWVKTEGEKHGIYYDPTDVPYDPECNFIGVITSYMKDLGKTIVDLHEARMKDVQPTEDE